MTPPALPPDVFDALPPAVQAYIRYLEARLADLEARLNQDSSNSSKPPSSDPPSAKPAPPRAPTGKPRGGQPGHPRRNRPALPPDTIVELRADTCGCCSHSPVGDDPDPLRHQVVGIPPIRPHVTEYRRHRLTCPRCGRINCPALPDDRRSGYGPRVQALCGVLAGAYRIGKRGVARLLQDLFGVPISPAVVCKLQHQTADALGPVAAAAQAHATGQPANVDETGWREGRKRGWLWVAVTAAVTVFLIRLSRGRKVLADLVPGEAGVLTTDRYPAYDHLAPEKRQVCWAHLRRDFQAMIDRKNAGSGIGGGPADPRRHLAASVEAGAGRDADPPGLPANLPRVDSSRGACPAGARVRVRLRQDGRRVPGVAGDRAGVVHVCRCGGCRADEQRGGACVATRGVLAEDELRDGLGRRESVRRAGADRRGLVPAAGPQRAGLPD